MEKVKFSKTVDFKRSETSVSSSAKTAFAQEDSKAFKNVMKVLAKR